MDSAHHALGTRLLSLFSDQEWDTCSHGLLWRMSLGLAADSLLLGSMSSAVFSPAPAPVPCSPFSDGARGQTGAPGGSCSLKDLLIPAFKGPELWPDEHQRQKAGCFYFFSSTAVSLIRCSQGFIEAYKIYVCFHQQRLWLCKSKQCRSVQYFLVQFSVALDGLYSASSERMMVWWCRVCSLSERAFADSFSRQ